MPITPLSSSSNNWSGLSAGAASSGGLDFSQILAGQLGGEAGLSDPLALGNAGGGALDQLLTMVLIQVVQRLLGSNGGAATEGAPSTPQGLPVAGKVSQMYHAGHRAIDLAVPVGTPIQATMGGRVVQAGWSEVGYGNLVILENGPYRTYYAHLSSIPVQTGQWVEAGSVIGLSGNTGNSTGPHLHYEVRRNGELLPPPGSV